MMQSPAESLRRHTGTAVKLAAAPAAVSITAASETNRGRVTYIGKPFPQWADIRRGLVDRNLEVEESADSREALSVDDVALASLVIIGESGGPRDSHEVCANVRRLSAHVPILLLTGSGDTVGRILGLENGADAWAAADADARSSLAQIRALLRRESAAAAASGTDRRTGILKAGDFVMNPASREVAVTGARVELTTLEFELLWNLLRHAGQVMSRERLARLIGYGPGMLEGRAIDTLVGRLRHRLGARHARRIRSIRAVGYMLCTDTLFDATADDSPAGH